MKTWNPYNSKRTAELDILNHTTPYTLTASNTPEDLEKMLQAYHYALKSNPLKLLYLATYKQNSAYFHAFPQLGKYEIFFSGSITKEGNPEARDFLTNCYINLANYKKNYLETWNPKLGSFISFFNYVNNFFIKQIIEDSRLKITNTTSINQDFFNELDIKNDEYTQDLTQSEKDIIASRLDIYELDVINSTTWEEKRFYSTTCLLLGGTNRKPRKNSELFLYRATKKMTLTLINHYRDTLKLTSKLQRKQEQLTLF